MSLAAERRAGILGAFVAAFLFGCHVLPPEHAVETSYGPVRADDPWQAHHVARLLEEHYPEVLGLIPGSTRRPIEVWLQPSPALYRLWSLGHEDADGFWAEGPSRIHLRERAENVERTLVHELVHASLDESWERLPGTVEEGLCDVISVLLCPRGARRMRAGRLSSAALATGGLALELSVAVPSAGPGGTNVHVVAQVRLEGADTEIIEPDSIFDVNAGLSSTRMSSERKKAYYGMAFLLVERIVENCGVDGLHALCERAEAEGEHEIPAEWLLEAAGLDGTFSTWRTALVAAFGPRELESLCRTHPEILAQLIVHQIRIGTDLEARPTPPPDLEAYLSIPGGGSGVRITDIRTLRQALLALW